MFRRLNVVVVYVENTLYSTNKYSCVRPVPTICISYFTEHNRDDEPHDFQLSVKIKILQYTKHELSNEPEKLINFSDVPTVTADSHSLTDTVDIDCLPVASVNRRYCRQINCEQGNYWRYSSTSIKMLMEV